MVVAKHKKRGVNLDIKKLLSVKNEYGINIENISLTLLINRETIPMTPDNPQSTFHSHLYSELFVCLSGEIGIRLEDEVITLSKNDALLVPINLPHHKIEQTDDGEWYSVGFSVTERAVRCHTNLYERLKPLCEGNEVTVFKNVPEICGRVAEMNKVLPQSIEFLPVVELVSVLIRLSAIKPKNQLAEKSVSIYTHDVFRIALLEDLIHARFSEPLTVGKVADILNISTRQLSRIIKTQYGMTFHQILTKIRLDNAANLLIGTDRSVSKIFSEVGYTKSSLFYKDFSEKFGTTPTEYRNTFKKE